MTLSIILAGLTALGAGIAAFGLIGAYRSARKDYVRAGERIDKMKSLGAEERDENRNRQPEEITAELSQARHERFERLYAEIDVVRPSYDSLPYLAAYEAQRLLGIILESTRTNLLTAGVGLLLSTAASIASLFVK